MAEEYQEQLGIFIFGELWLFGETWPRALEKTTCCLATYFYPLRLDLGPAASLTKPSQYHLP